MARSFVEPAVFLSALFLFFQGASQALSLPLAPPADIGERPAAAFITGQNVNLRGTPSMTGEILGRLSGISQEELVVVDCSLAKDGSWWYRILSERVGEGWVNGHFLEFQGLEDGLRRFCLGIRRDFGVTRDLAGKNLGKPQRTETISLNPEDMRVPVTESVYVYPFGKVVFWSWGGKDFLFSVQVTGRRSFGGIWPGDGTEKVFRFLGSPREAKNRVWTWHSGMERISISFGADARAERLVYERDPF